MYLGVSRKVQNDRLDISISVYHYNSEVYLYCTGCYYKLQGVTINCLGELTSGIEGPREHPIRSALYPDNSSITPGIEYNELTVLVATLLIFHLQRL